MIDFGAAVDFVRRHGTALDNARLDHLLGREFDRGRVLDGFASIQNPDGGFPYGDRPGFPSGVSNTAKALGMLLELGLGRTGPARRAVDFLLDMRREGIWPENPMIAPLGPPFWDMPGDDRTTLWLTADVTDTLLRMDLRGIDLEPAGEFIAGHQAPDGRFMGYIHTTWLAVAVFGKSGLDRPDVFTAALGYLETMDDLDWDAASTAWCLESLERGGAGDSPLVGRLIAMLGDLQRQDGGWAVEGPERLEPGTAVDVMFSLGGERVRQGLGQHSDRAPPP